MSVFEQIGLAYKTRPAYWGPRHRNYVGLPLFLQELLKVRAEEAGVTLSEYVAMKMAEQEGYALPHPRPDRLKKLNQQDRSDQDRLPLGA